MAFDKGHEKLGGRKKGTRNKGTDSIKTLLNTILPEEELAGLWKQKLYSKNPHVALEAFKLALNPKSLANLRPAKKGEVTYDRELALIS
jgi:hypothetical protein